MSDPQQTTADAKSAAAKAWAIATANPTVTNGGSPADAPGCTLWLVGGRGGVVVIMPTLLRDAPPSVWLRYRDRIIANATGRCPRCDATSGIDGPGHGQMAHETTCPLDEAKYAPWVDQRGVAILTAWAETL